MAIRHESSWLESGLWQFATGQVGWKVGRGDSPRVGLAGNRACASCGGDSLVLSGMGREPPRVRVIDCQRKAEYTNSVTPMSTFGFLSRSGIPYNPPYRGVRRKNFRIILSTGILYGNQDWMQKPKGFRIIISWAALLTSSKRQLSALWPNPHTLENFYELLHALYHYR